MPARKKALVLSKGKALVANPKTKVMFLVHRKAPLSVRHNDRIESGFSEEGTWARKQA